MRQFRPGAYGDHLRPIGAVVERWLLELGGPERLAAFRQLPEAMQRGAWEGLRRQIEREREGEDT